MRGCKCIKSIREWVWECVCITETLSEILWINMTLPFHKILHWISWGLLKSPLKGRREISVFERVHVVVFNNKLLRDK